MHRQPLRGARRAIRRSTPRHNRTPRAAQVTEQLRLLVREEQEYAAAKDSALGKLASGFELDWSKPGKRDELHAREDLR